MQEEKRDRETGSVGSGVLGRSASGSRLSAEAKSQMKHTQTSRAQLRSLLWGGPAPHCRQSAGIQRVSACQHFLVLLSEKWAQRTLNLHQLWLRYEPGTELGARSGPRQLNQASRAMAERQACCAP